MAYLKIGDVDFSGIVSALKVGYQVLLGDTSGRNAAGTTMWISLTGKRNCP